MGRYTWDRMHIFQPPAGGDEIVLPSGTYTLKGELRGWSLVDTEGNRHPQIGVVDGMVDLLAQIWRVGNREEAKAQ